MPASDSISPATSLQIRVAGTFTLEPLEEFLSFWLPPLGLIGAEISIGGYNQLFQELLNPALPAMGKERGVNFFLVRLEDVLRDSGASKESRLDQVRRVTLELLAAFQSFSVRVWCCCVPPRNRVKRTPPCDSACTWPMTSASGHWRACRASA